MTSQPYSPQLVPEHEKDGGSFLTGFVLGSVVGVAGLFLFGTKKGNVVLHSLEKEWNEAKTHIKEELGEAFEESSFRDVVKHVVSDVEAELQSLTVKQAPRQQKPVQRKRFFFNK